MAKNLLISFNATIYKKVSKILHFVLAYRNKTCYVVSIHKNKEVIESYEQK